MDNQKEMSEEEALELAKALIRLEEEKARILLRAKRKVVEESD